MLLQDITNHIEFKFPNQVCIIVIIEENELSQQAKFKL